MLSPGRAPCCSAVAAVHGRHRSTRQERSHLLFRSLRRPQRSKLVRLFFFYISYCLFFISHCFRLISRSLFYLNVVFHRSYFTVFLKYLFHVGRNLQTSFSLNCCFSGQTRWSGTARTRVASGTWMSTATRGGRRTHESPGWRPPWTAGSSSLRTSSHAPANSSCSVLRWGFFIFETWVDFDRQDFSNALVISLTMAGYRGTQKMFSVG